MLKALWGEPDLKMNSYIPIPFYFLSVGSCNDCSQCSALIESLVTLYVSLFIVNLYGKNNVEKHVNKLELSFVSYLI